MAEGADAQTQRFTNAADPYDRRAAEQELRWFSGGWTDPAAPIGLVIADAGDDSYLGAVLLFRAHGVRRRRAWPSRRGSR